MCSLAVAAEHARDGAAGDRLPRDVRDPQHREARQGGEEAKRPPGLARVTYPGTSPDAASGKIL